MKSVLITGATSGIGYALALAAAQKGYQVVATGRNTAILAEMSTITNITTLGFDVTDVSACKAAIANLHIDIAILNAGTCEYVDVDAFDSALFHRVFNANFFGVVNMVEALMPQLSRCKQVVIVDSLARLLPFARSSAYGASKAALHYFTKSLEVDLSSRGVLIQSVSPGFVTTPLTNKNDFAMPAKVTAEFAAKRILQGIESGQKSIYFPFVFSFVLRCLAHLPNRLKVSLSKRLKS